MGLRIRQLRNGKGWSQQELADRSRMSRSQLAMIEAETRPANTLRLNAIAAALDVDPEDLFESSPQDRAVLDLIKALNPADRAVIVRMAEAFAAKGEKA